MRAEDQPPRGLRLVDNFGYPLDAAVPTVRTFTNHLPQEHGAHIVTLEAEKAQKQGHFPLAQALLNIADAGLSVSNMILGL